MNSRVWLNRESAMDWALRMGGERTPFPVFELTTAQLARLTEEPAP
jgi:hypothetical protein